MWIRDYLNGTLGKGSQRWYLNTVLKEAEKRTKQISFSKEQKQKSYPPYSEEAGVAGGK